MREFTRTRTAETPDEIWLVEHGPVFTLGVAGRAEHVLDAGAIAVLRTDRGIETLGRMADLVPIDSPLRLFAEGRYGSLSFLLVGMAQLKHAAGSQQLGPDEAQLKTRIMQRILVNDAEIRHLAEPWLEDLDQLMKGKSKTVH